MRALLRSLPLALLVAGSSVAGFGCSKDTRFTSIVPNTGTYTGGEDVVLKGANFPRGGVTVRFGGHEAQPVVMESDSRIHVATPAGEKNTNVDVQILFDDGRGFVLKNGFRYLDNAQQRQIVDKFFDKAAGKK